MASLLEKVSTLISANVHYLIDQALKSNSMAVIDHYIRELENNLETMEDAAATIGGEIKSLKRKLHLQEHSAAELDRGIDAFLKEDNETMAITVQGKLNRTQRLIETYQEQVTHLEAEYQKLLGAKLTLEDRLSTMNQQRGELRALLDLAKSKETVVKAMKGLADLRDSRDTDISRIAQCIYARLDKASAITEMRATGIEEQIGHVLNGNAVAAQLAERKKKLLKNE